ncbi:uncharacterized protein [Misgurnus anguillicaudatus]|uniref:uncharacterized protein n=1 Tax=Misgurnus anguillicaudatus TaxID=75329 RepID=UPI003CCF6E13
MDRHLFSHSELSAKARRVAFAESKRQKILSELATLRATNPAVPMVSSLDLRGEGEQAGEGTSAAAEEDAEPQDCGSEACARARDRLRATNADLNEQVDALTSSLAELTRRYKKLLRRQTARPAQEVRRVTGKLLGALEAPVSPDREEAPPEATGDSPPEVEAGPVTPPPLPEEEAEESSGPQFPDHVVALNELLAEFRRHHEGPEPSRKLRDNVTSKIFRIRAFVAYVAEGKSRLATLRFMDDPERMRTWVTNLRASKMTETTLNHYLNNVAQFLDYIHETPPPTSRLSKKSMLGIRREVRALLKGLRRGVVMHQIGVKQAKEGRVIPKAVLRQCLSEAKKRIPEVLDQLENDLQQKTQFSFYGYLTAYYASIYGHRLGVFQNLTIREVEGAVKSPSTGDYLINISLHKTNRAFGPAQLSLTAEEYGWFRRFLALRDRLVGGPDARLFFYTSTPNPCKNLNNYFQGAWVSMGLPGKPTFMDARNTHSKADREKVSKFMCHDTSTADRFYAMNLNVKQAVEHRRLFEGALVGEEVSPANPAAEVE